MSSLGVCSGGSPARHDGPHRLGNDGDTRQDHPHQYHFDVDKAAKASGVKDYGASTSDLLLYRFHSDTGYLYGAMVSSLLNANNGMLYDST